MNRKEFIEKLGFGAAFVLAVGCFGGCSKGESVYNYLPDGPVDFTIDLSDPSNAALAENGGYVIRNKTVVARNTDGDYVAATERCSHEGTYAMVLKDNEWFCTDHDARFDLVSGDGLNKDGKGGLTIYQTELTGTQLRIYSV